VPLRRFRIKSTACSVLVVIFINLQNAQPGQPRIAEHADAGEEHKHMLAPDATQADACAR